MAGLQTALAPLARLSGHDRACVFQLDDDGEACVLVAEWDAADASGIAGQPGRGARWRVADLPQVWRPLLAGDAWQATMSRGGAADVTDHIHVMIPIVVEDRCWGCLGFHDRRGERRYGESELRVLHGAASAVAAAVHRHQTETRRLDAERARTDDARTLGRLTQSVVRATRELLDCTEFGTGIRQWLGHLGRAAEADVAMLVSPGPDQPGADTLGTWQHGWRRDGGASLPPPVPSTTDFDGWLTRLLEQQAIWADIDQLVDPASVRYWRATECATILLVPVILSGVVRLSLCFYWRERHPHSSSAEAVLRTAAASLSAVLQRQIAVDGLLREREARLLAEQLRSSELSRANRALRQALEGLAGNADESAFLKGALVQLQRQTGARAAYLFCTDDADGRLRLMGRAIAGRFSDEPQHDDPDFFARGFRISRPELASMKSPGGFLWRRVDPDATITDRTSESMRWHLRMKHRAHATHALMVGERPVGFIGLAFDDPEPLSEVELNLGHALSQPITLTLELARLSRLARRSGEQTAMLNERTRLAREIHDGIAQAFLAIRMQLDAPGDGASGASPVHKAIALARHGLAEARRAVAALRPHDLQDCDLPDALRRLLVRTEEETAVACSLISPPGWQSLPGQVEDSLFRIVQEAVHNAVRHGGPRQIRVELSQAAGEATVLVADDGTGFDAERLASSQGFGLESMQQRARMIGARIDLLSRPGSGTEVLLSWLSTSLPLGDAPSARKASR